MSERLQALTQILVGSRSGLTAAPDLAPAEHQLHAVPFERIKQLTAFLEKTGPHAIDDVDTLSAHLLLNDVTVAISQLRAIAQITTSRIDAAGGSLKPVRNFLHRQAKIADKHSQRLS